MSLVPKNLFSAKNFAGMPGRRAILWRMARYRTQITTPRRPEDTFEYMAAFENVAEWDPGVAETQPLDPGPPRAGSRYRVVVSAAGTKMPLEYRITEFDPPRRVLLLAETSVLRSVDEISVEPAPGGSTVTYDANLELLGLLRVLNPALAVVFKRVGDRAAAGLRRRLQA